MIHKQTLPAKIGLLSNSGCGNLGETATQLAIIHNIRRYYPEAAIHSFSPYPETAQQVLDIPSFPTTSILGNGWLEGSEENTTIATNLINVVKRLKTLPSYSLWKIPKKLIGDTLELMALIRAYKYLKDFDILIVSGGGQLDDHCFGGRWGYPFTILLWGILAKLCDVQYFIVSVGAGPLDFWKSRLFIKYALPLAQYRSYRDEDAKRYIKEVVGFHENDPVYPDLANSLQITKYQQLVDEGESIQREDYRLVVGINTYTGSIMTGPITELTPPYPCIGQGTLYADYTNKLASFVSWLVKNQYQVVFIASETYEEAHDCRQITKDVRAILGKNEVVYAENQIIDDSNRTVDDLMTKLSMIDLVVASRFHCVLLSMLMNNPVLALSFNSKIDRLMEDRGQAEYCLQVDKFDLDTLKDRFRALEANRVNIKHQLAKRTQEYKEALNEQYERLFTSI